MSNPTNPTAVRVDDGVDLLLPLQTPLEVLDAFVASCNIGECGCGDSFVSRITGVELFDEPGQRRVRINGNVTPDEVLTELAATSLSKQS
ncbi:MAG: hypothetical protein ACP5OV_08115 [Acidimicrobiales bacterium]